jgi:hypothetical protein
MNSIAHKISRMWRAGGNGLEHDSRNVDRSSCSVTASHASTEDSR